MKLKLLFIFLILTQILTAQTFTEKIGTPFDGVDWGSIAFADVDGDNDPDVLIIGQQNNLDIRIAKLYTNDGTGNFTEKMGTPFEGLRASTIAFADVDGDNDPDVLITGQNSSSGAGNTKLYINDGTGNFTEKTGMPFDGFARGSIAFADVDGDNDPDLLITGSTFGVFTKLYTNDGTGNFTENTSTPFDSVRLSSIAFADVDGDNDSDVLITGRNSSNARIAKLYINDGTGNFTEKTGTPFDGVSLGSIAFADVDEDNDPDVFITGQNSSDALIAKLYTNDGMGNFTEKMGTPFEGFDRGSIAFADVDGDNAPDVLMTGSNSSFALIAKLYINDGTGNFTENTGTPFEDVIWGSIAFADVDGDNDPDVLITGQNSSEVSIAILYTNDGVVSFTTDLKNGLSLGFILYPNPSTSGTLNLSFDAKVNGDVTVKVYNINGILLRQQKEFTTIGQQVISIDTDSLPPESYFIELYHGKRKGVATFIVQ